MNITCKRPGVISAVVSLLMLLSTSSAIQAQEETAAIKIARAASAAPPSVSDEATIMDVDGTVLRQGTNGWICFPGVGLIPGDKHPMCNDKVWMAWMKAAEEGTPFSTDVIGISYMLQGDALVNNDDPSATNPHHGGAWVQEGPHLMLLMPASMAKDLPTTPDAAGPYVMWADTPMVHVMVPVAPRFE